jgi:alkylmercury lyase
VTGSHGLSVTPTAHAFQLDGRRFWTWCARDAVGILGALGATGRVRSHSPHSGAPIQLDFHAGRPSAPSDVVVFMADQDCCTSVADDWCPLVNFFEDARAATAWAAQQQAAGTPLPLAEATRTGTAHWRAHVAPVADPTTTSTS